MKKNEKGFTLMEMLIVLFIIGVILAIALPNLTKAGDVAEKKAEDANKKMLLAQAENYRLAHDDGEYPSSVQQLLDEGYIESIPKCADKDKEFTFDLSGDSISVNCE